MVGQNKTTLARRILLSSFLALCCASFSLTGLASAVTAESGAIGVEGTIPGAPPTRGATITVPSNGQSFTSEPVTVSGICPSGLLIKIFDNNVFVGSTICISGSYSLQIDLFSDRNDLVATDYDSLSQSGPSSSTVTVEFNSAQFTQFGNHVTLSSAYAEKGAPPGSQISWPVLLSGGTSPYAISVDWGDGTAPELISRSTIGTINITHTYKSAGVYSVIIKATDKNGEEAFLQLVGQATGAVQHNDKAALNNNQIIEKQIIWWPALLIVPLSLIAFWLGLKYENQRRNNRL
jgi:hypothetical protein